MKAHTGHGCVPAVPSRFCPAAGACGLLLQGTNASPLRKALNDSALGSALLGGGMDDELKQPIFRCV